MRFDKLPSNSQKFLNELINCEQPESLLKNKVMKSSPDDRNKLYAVLDELKERGFIQVEGSYLEPKKIVLSNLARTYEEQLIMSKLPSKKAAGQSISIGDGNRFKNTTISITNNSDNQRKNFFEKHPIICGIIISVIAAFVMMFSFWEQIVAFVEGFFS